SGESDILTALGAAATGTVETTIVGGLKYSSNKGGTKPSAPIIEDWKSDSDDDYEIRPSID
nr:hypothetical protein [Tanacetum cinerariifolium]